MRLKAKFCVARRKLDELGYRRTAKKCKEKFENVHKYYKRTKENRAGRQDGKTYRFFSQLEALHASAPTTPTQSTIPNLPLASVQMPTQISVASPATIGFSEPMAGPSRVVAPVTPIETPSQPKLQSIHDIGTSGPPQQGISGSTTPTTAAPTTAGISFSSNTESSESDESDDEDTEEIGGMQEQGKRKRQGGSGGGSSKKMMSFFEGLMKQVMERQESMQQRFLETIEKREQDRMIREEAWRRQEMARLSREQEILSQERAMAASRDAAVVSFIQKITGQTIPAPTIPAPVITVVPPPPRQPVPVTVIPQLQSHQPHQHSQSHPSPKTPQQLNQQPLQPRASTPPAVPQPQHQLQPQPQQKLQQQQPQSTDIVAHQQQPPVTSTEMVRSVPETHEPCMGAGFEPGSSSATSSRWPKAEVHALIKIRSGLDSRYQEAGPKGPLWEEISAGMRRLGYNRNAKRCKEKWENINKYFKKVKEGNKKRPEDSKTCPYFHQLDALYRKKYRSTTSGAGGSQFDAKTNPNSQDSPTFSGSAPPHRPTQPQAISQQPPAVENVSRNSNAGKDNTDSNDNNQNGNGTDGGNGGTGGNQIKTSNGGTTTTFYSDPNSMGLKKVCNEHCKFSIFVR
jgi:Myb/SANT-like DNA-binding domain